MDGFDPSAGLVLLAATNRPEILDPTLLRAGRFDRQVLVARPDKTGRVQILKVHLKKVRLAPDADPEKIAALTPGFSGAGAFDRARGLLRENRPTLERGAQLLLEKETLNEEDLKELGPKTAPGSMGRTAVSA